MSENWKTRTLFLALVLFLFIGLSAVYYWRFRTPNSANELFDHLPKKDSMVVQVDFRILKAMGMLNVIAGSPVVEEEEYRRFVHETAFDYRTDLDQVVLSFVGEERFALAVGRFDFQALKNYVIVHGGKCNNGLCSLAGNRGERFVSFVPLRQNVVGWASSTDQYAAYQLIRSKAETLNYEIPNAPLWLMAPRAYWKNASSLPDGTKLFAKALEDADSTVFSITAAAGSPQAVLEAYCPNESVAVSLESQLQGVTDVFSKYLERANQKPGPADLGGILINGKFDRQGKKVVGRWSLERAFLEALIGGRF